MTSRILKNGMTMATLFVAVLYSFTLLANAQTAGTTSAPPVNQTVPSQPSVPPPTGQTGMAPQQPAADQGATVSPPSGTNQNNQPQTPPPSQGGSFQGGQQAPPPNGNWQLPKEGDSVQNFQGNYQGQRDRMESGDFKGASKRPPMMRPGGEDGDNGNFKNFQGQAQWQPPMQRQIQNFQDGSGDSFGSNGGNGNGNDWEAQQQKMEAEQQKREEQMVKRQAAQIAKQLQQAVTSFNKRAAKLQNAGIPLTQECVQTVSVFTDAIAQVKSAQTVDDLQNAQDAMESMDDLNQCRSNVERLMRVPKMMKSVTSTVARLKKKKIDVSEAESAFADLQSQFDKMKSGSYSNDDVDAFFDSADELGNIMGPLMGRPNDQGAAVFNSGVWDTIKSWFGF